MAKLTLLLLLVTVLVGQSARAGSKKIKCRDGLTAVYCKGIKGAKKDGFCFKGNPTKEKKKKACLSERSAKRKKPFIRAKAKKRIKTLN